MKNELGDAVQSTKSAYNLNEKLIVKFNKIMESSTLISLAVVNSHTVNVAEPEKFTVGHQVIIFSNILNEFYIGEVLDITGPALTLDSPLDSPFPVGSNIDDAITNMNVDGSGTPVVFGLRGKSGPSSIARVGNITRIIFHCLTTSTVTLALFANLPKLLRGLVLRRNGEKYSNIFNVKSNGDIDGITMDFKAYSASNLQQGQYGFTARLTFNGPDKLDAIEQLTSEEDLEIVIQDNFLAITHLEITAEGNSTCCNILL